MSAAHPVLEATLGLLLGAAAKALWLAIPVSVPDVPSSVRAPEVALDRLDVEVRAARAAFLTDWGRPPAPPRLPADYDVPGIRARLAPSFADAGGSIYAADCTPYPCRALGVLPAGGTLSVPGAQVHHQERDGATEVAVLFPLEQGWDPAEQRFVERLTLTLRAGQLEGWRQARAALADPPRGPGSP